MRKKLLSNMRLLFAGILFIALALILFSKNYENISIETTNPDGGFFQFENTTAYFSQNYVPDDYHPLIGVDDLFFDNNVKKNKITIKGTAKFLESNSLAKIKVVTSKKTLQAKTRIDDARNFATSIKIPSRYYKISKIKIYFQNSENFIYPFFLEATPNSRSTIIVQDYKKNDFSKKLFDFVYRNEEGLPSRWNPCSTIFYQINPTNMPYYAEKDIAKAFSILAESSGYVFEFAGYTDTLPFSEEKQFTNDTITIAFASKETVPLVKNYLAIAGAVTDPATNRVKAGSVVVNAPAHDFKKGFSNKDLSFGRVILHELGHAMNLDHVASPSEIMHEFISVGSGPSTYQAGDREGLSTLYSLGCFNDFS